MNQKNVLFQLNFDRAFYLGILIMDQLDQQQSLNVFFFTCPVGFENIVLNEITQTLISLNYGKFSYKLENGGVECELPLLIGLSLNQYLKTITRVLLRIANFKCRDFPKLYNKTLKCDWKDYLTGQTPVIKSSAFKSRLFDSRKIEESVVKALKKYFKANPAKAINIEYQKDYLAPTIYVRLVEDMCQISLDTSGERLDKRGYKTLTTKAPIRENIAAALLQSSFQSISVNDYHFYDPMCGSGTNLIEAFLNGININCRSFDYLFFPLTKKLTATKKILPAQKHFISYQASDIDTSILKIAAANLSSVVSLYPDAEQCQLEQQDFFKLKKSDMKYFFFLNPPYGIRIKHDREDFLNQILVKVKNDFPHSMLGIICPQDKVKELSSLKVFKRHIQFEFENGGILVSYFLLSLL